MERVTLEHNSGYDYLDFDNLHVSRSSANRESVGEKLVRPSKTKAVSAPVVSSSNQLLKSLPSQQFNSLRPSLRSVFLEAEQFLYLQDAPLDYVYFPETAVISELRTLEDGRMVEIAITGREGAVGLSALFCSSRVANCTQVSQAGSAVRIESSVLVKMARLDPELARVLTPHVAQYIRQISQRAICNMY